MSESPGIIPKYVQEEIARNGSKEQREIARKSLREDDRIRSERARQEPAAHEEADAESEGEGEVEGAGPPRRNRLIYSAQNGTTLPGTLVRDEAAAPVGDAAVDEAHDGLGATFDLFSDIYGRNSIDDNGRDLIGTVHYGSSYNNAFWDGTQMVFGDGDGSLFNRFTIAIDVMGHELTHAVTELTAGLVYQGQSGALNESVSDCFGSLVKQRFLGQSASQADWLIGAGLFTESVKARALRSMSAPGTAYDDPVIGKDPQPDHMSRYVSTSADNGGVHINSGIPNKAFYLAAVGLGGANAWDVAGRIWYDTLRDTRLSATATFVQFARLTADHARALAGDAGRSTVVEAWRAVGITVDDEVICGVQWVGSVPANSSRRWFTFNWPAEWHVIWTVMPRTVQSGAPQLGWDVHVERASTRYATYWITVTNKTGTAVEFEGRFCILSKE